MPQRTNCSLSSTSNSVEASTSSPAKHINSQVRSVVIEGVIFDVDGTLADSGKLGYDATLAILEKYNLPPVSYEEYCGCTGCTTPDRLARHAGLEPGTEEFQSMGQKLGQEFDDLYIELVSLETAGFFPGMLDLLRKLPDSVQLGALTNAVGRYAHRVLSVNCPDLYKNRFASILGADQVTRPKPHADGLWQACREMKISMGTTNNGYDPNPPAIYIGDSPSDGIAAKAANMMAIGVTWGAHNRETLQQSGAFAHVCSTVDELEIVLQQYLEYP